MKSFFVPEGVSFGALQERLIRFVNDRISNGDFSERGLARMLRVSQPQIHNILKGARNLTTEMADRVLSCFGMSVLDLLDSSELKMQLSHRHEGEVPPPAAVAPHVEIRRFSPGAGIPRKQPDRQSSRRRHDLTNTA